MRCHNISQRLSAFCRRLVGRSIITASHANDRINTNGLNITELLFAQGFTVFAIRARKVNKVRLMLLSTGRKADPL